MSFGPDPIPPEERFWDKVDATGDCWEWTAATANGYGKFAAGKGMARAHRFVWEMMVGPIPEGMHIDHLCRNKVCVNPDHLEPVTPKENFNRGYRFSHNPLNRYKQEPPPVCHGEPLDLEVSRRYLGVARCLECDALARRGMRAWRRQGKPGDAPNLDSSAEDFVAIIKRPDFSPLV